MGTGGAICRVSALVLVLLSISTQCSGKDLTVAAFNVQIFGQNKAKDEFVMGILTKLNLDISCLADCMVDDLSMIILRYDIILIQEIRDSKQTAIKKLLKKVNAATPSNIFDIEISQRLGRTNSKEQYAFLYRKKAGLRVVESLTYDDSNQLENTKNSSHTDSFEREPYILLFTSTSTKLSRFAIGGVHIAPSKAVEELKALKEVFVDVQQRLRVNDVMMMGDLNADCGYVPQYRWAEIALKSDPSCHWLIGDEVDTTVSNTHCAYDRFIGKGTGFSTESNGGVVPGSAKVFDYQAAYGLTSEQALDVSDHFPIEFKLKGKPQDSIASAEHRLKSVQILNVYIAVPGKSLSNQKTYYINNLLNVDTADGVSVGALRNETPKEKDIRFAIEKILELGLNENKISVKMTRSRKWNNKQLSDITIKVSHILYPEVKILLDNILQDKYGNVRYV